MNCMFAYWIEKFDFDYETQVYNYENVPKQS